MEEKKIQMYLDIQEYLNFYMYYRHINHIKKKEQPNVTQQLEISFHEQIICRRDMKLEKGLFDEGK